MVFPRLFPKGLWEPPWLALKIEMFKYKAFKNTFNNLKKVILMDFLKNKKAFVTHPVVMFITALILGLVLAYLWINYTTVPNPFCK